MRNKGCLSVDIFTLAWIEKIEGFLSRSLSIKALLRMITGVRKIQYKLNRIQFYPF